MTATTITLPFGGTGISIKKLSVCDASSDFSIDLGEILTALIVADDAFYQKILIAREQARQGNFLSHEEVFGTD